MFGGRKEQNKNGNIQNKTSNKKQQKTTKDNNKKRKTQPQHEHKKNSQIATHYQPKSHRDTTNQPQHNKSIGQTPQNGTLSQILKPTGEQRGPRFHPQGGCLSSRQLPKYFDCAPIKTLYFTKTDPFQGFYWWVRSKPSLIWKKSSWARKYHFFFRRGGACSYATNLRKFHDFKLYFIARQPSQNLISRQQKYFVLTRRGKMGLSFLVV